MPPTPTPDRRDGWDRKEDLVLETLERVRLSSDAALSGVNEIKTELAVMKALNENERQQQGREIQELKDRFRTMNTWLMGILATLILGGLKWVFETLTISHIMPK